MAYALVAHIDDIALGGPRRARTDELLSQVLGHFSQWFDTYKWETNPTIYEGTKFGLTPFMVGLSMEALIRYYEEIGQDSRIQPAIQKAVNGLYSIAWQTGTCAGTGAFYYDTYDRHCPPGWSSLNMLIAPAYAWMYKQTRDTSYRSRFDELFSEAVCRGHYDSVGATSLCTKGNNGEAAYLWSGKQFNQQYRWSMQGVQWRGP
jgi:hypothetical protein